ncbi:MAG: hypothetical protein H6828_13835 [Planctomycetes bacterium]|nr:hypothetical protein [Planctomycetota bacterium]
MSTTERERYLAALALVEEARRAERRRVELEREAQASAALLAALAAEVESTEGDLERLRHVTWEAFVRELVGDRKERLHEREAARAAAELRHDEARREHERRVEELETWRARAAALPAAAAELDEARARWSTARRALGDAVARELGELDEGEAALARELRELAEAGDAAAVAQDSLRAVLETLRKVRNWGTFDLLGGGAFVTMMKHGGIDRARVELEEAKQDLRVLSRELLDVGVDLEETEIELSSGWRFADIFLDNIFTDLSVQQRITGWQAEVEALLADVEALEDGLLARNADVARRLDAARARRDALLGG